MRLQFGIGFWLAWVGAGLWCLAKDISSPLMHPGNGPARLILISSAVTGVQFTNHLSELRGLTNQIYLNGSGVALGDVDGDGRNDLVFAGLEAGNTLYLNRGGWRFERSMESGITCADSPNTGVALVDLDGDRDLDLAVNTIGFGTRIFLNDGAGRFSEKRDAGTQTGSGAMSMALADVDDDGDLDLYVVNYRTRTLRDEPNTRFSYKYDAQRIPYLAAVNGRSVTNADLVGRFVTRFHPDGRAEQGENGEVDAFFLNRGNAMFERIPLDGGAFLTNDGKPVGPLYDWGLSAMFRDLNGDGRPDLYVCNDFESPDRIWFNETPPGGPVRFRAAPDHAFRHISLFSMGIDVADVNRDGLPDVFVADMLHPDRARRKLELGDKSPETVLPGDHARRPQINRNTLHVARPNGTWSDLALFCGVAATGWSWTPLFLDLDLDGWEDLLVTAGHARDAQNADLVEDISLRVKRERLSPLDQLLIRREVPALPMTNSVFRNRGRLQFAPAAAEWGFDSVGVSHGMAAADLDSDGDMDVVVSRLNAPPLIYRNDAPAGRILLTLRGSRGNTHGIGATATVTGGPVVQGQEWISGGRYLSSDAPARTFATGGASTVDVTVRWRSGTVSSHPGLKAGLSWELQEPATPSASGSSPAPTSSKEPLLFEDVSGWLNHQDAAVAGEDFLRQPTLPHRMGMTGPGAAWMDVDGNGFDDLVVGSSGGGLPVRFLNQDGKAFTVDAAFGAVIPGTVSSLNLRLAGGGGLTTLAIRGDGKVHEEGADGVWGSVVEFPFGTQASVLAAADVDGDGQLEVFAGGVPAVGNHPRPAGGGIWRRTGGRWELMTKTNAFHRPAGIRSAVFADFSGDGFPELLVVGDWGAPQLFTRDGHQWAGSPMNRGLAEWSGMWTSVATGDFDGDGRLDFVAGNHGLNTLESGAMTPGPLAMDFGDFDRSGSLDVVLSRREGVAETWMPISAWKPLIEAMPVLRVRFPRRGAYARASMADLLHDLAPTEGHVEIRRWESTLFLNRGETFEARPLPGTIQWSPAWGIAVADFDGDGALDLFAGQNFSGNRAEDGRLDSGQGTLLLGDGRGGWKGDPAGSALFPPIHGDARAVAVSDFDRDGRSDVVVTQHGARTRLFRNVGGAVGWRVSVNAGAGNPSGIGAAIRLIAGNQHGPIQEIGAGLGHMSQSSPVTVATVNGSADKIWIRLPGGRELIRPLPEKGREVHIRAVDP